MFLVKLLSLLAAAIFGVFYLFSSKDTGEIPDRLEMISSYFEGLTQQHQRFIDSGYVFNTLNDLHDMGFMDEVEPLFLGPLEYDEERKLAYITLPVSHDEHTMTEIFKDDCVKINEQFQPMIRCVKGEIDDIKLDSIKLKKPSQLNLIVGMSQAGTKVTIFTELDYRPAKKEENSKKDKSTNK